MPRWTTTLGTFTAAAALVGIALFGGAGAAMAAPTPGYPGGYPGGGYSGGGTPGGIDTTNPTAGGSVTVTAACQTGAGARLTLDGTPIATAGVSGGNAALTGNIPASARGAHTVVATCDSGKTFSFNITVQAPGTSSSGSLASTGAKVATFAGGGIVLVAAGVGIVFLARRRSHGTAA